ncbi:MAG: hypothetical protein ACKVZJ_11950 [Phycisphaerales bacterium]
MGIPGDNVHHQAAEIALAVLVLNRERRKMLALLWADFDRAERRNDPDAKAAAVAAATELFQSPIPTIDITNE